MDDRIVIMDARGAEIIERPPENPMEQLNDEQQEQVKLVADRIIRAKKAKRMGSAVFCVSCGARQRTLYKWHNSYICRDCRKILLDVGEERFLKALRGEDE